MYTITLSFISVVILAVIILSSLKVIRYVPYDRCSGEKRLLVSLGSGGHTTEMLLMLQTINLEEFTKRYYYISSGDSLSHQKLLQFESARCSGEDCYQVRTVARARKVKQPWLTTPVTALISFIDAVRLIYTDLPDLMICNGPGTCVMLVLAILLLRVRPPHEGHKDTMLTMSISIPVSNNVESSSLRALPEWKA